MKAIYTSADNVDLGEHPWDRNKYRLIAEHVVNNGWIQPQEITSSIPASDEDVLRVHSAEYYRKLCEFDFTEEEQALAEVPLTPSMIDLAWRTTGGTLQATLIALEEGIAAHIGGGFHHAHAGHAAGFCIINDIAVSIQALLDDGRINNALVIDCDVHQGDGTAAIFRNEPRVFTFSIHQQNGYPYFKKPGSFDVELEDDTSDDAHLAALSRALDQILDSGKQCDLVHYQSGVDPYGHDVLGNLCLSEEGLRKRDEMVIGRARALGIPVVITLGGGYTADVGDVVRLHAQTLRVAAQSNL